MSHRAKFRFFLDPASQIIFCCTLLAVLGVSTLAPALPHIAEALRLAPEAAGALITVFTLPGIFFSPVAGILADKWGRRPALVSSLILFAAAGTACFFVRDFRILLLFRFLQGIGACFLGVMSLTLIGDFYSGPSRTAMMGLNASVLSVGTATYPLIGGYLTGFGWRIPFLLPMLALPVLAFVLTRLPDAGAGHEGLWGEYFRESFRALSNRLVLILMLLMIAMFVLVYGICLTAFPFMMDGVFDASPLHIGFYLTLMSAGTLAASWHLKEVSAWLGRRGVIAAGFFLYTAGCAMLPAVRGTAGLVAACLMIGTANGLNIPALHVWISEASPPAHRGVFMALASAVVRVGQTLGPFAAGALMTHQPLRTVFISGMVLSLGMILMLSVLPQDRGKEI